MKTRLLILTAVVLFLAVPSLAILISDTSLLGWNLQYKKCSLEIEQLSLCTNTSKITLNVNEPAAIEVIWVNVSDSERYLGRQSLDYSLEVYDEKGEKLIPIFIQKQMESQKRLAADPQSGMTEDDLKEIKRWTRRGSGRGLDVQAQNQVKDEIRLTEIDYDFEFTKKGKYKVTIRRTVPSLEEEKTIEFVLGGIEIEVK